MNCLEFSLKYWNESKVPIWYNGEHCINIKSQVENYLALEEYGYEHFINSFPLRKKYVRLLKKYFKR